MRVALGVFAALIGTVLLVPIAVAAVPFWLVAWCTRALARLCEPDYLTRDQLIEFDPAFGWRPRANIDSHHLMVDLFQVSTDTDGWRGRSTLEDSDIVVFGDSFAAGYGVDDQHLFANLHPRPRMKPIGTGGYSMVQELLWMKHLAGRLRGKRVVWFIYYGNDLADNLSPELRGYRKPFVREARGRGEWEIVSTHVSPERWPIATPLRVGLSHVHMTKLAELCAETFLAQRAYGACEYLIREGQRICDGAGAELVIFTIPDVHQLHADGHRFLQSIVPQLPGFDPGLPDRRVDAICRRLGVTHVAGSRIVDVECYKQNDCHWNELGHRKVAAWLRDLHRRGELRPDREGGGLHGPALVRPFTTAS